MSPGRLFSTIGWGLFCACSWTWCIGMYLPAILLRDYGWPGFLVFAVPNVLGCMLFGYVMKTRARSEAFIDRHAGAATWFSLITVAFHLAFIALLTTVLAPMWTKLPSSGLLIALGVFVAGLALSHLPDRVWPWVAVIVYVGSLTAFFMIGGSFLGRIAGSGEFSARGLIWLAPTFIFGFALSPYFDLTFHRALQQSPSRHAFAVFGLTFTIMIALTCVLWNGGLQAVRWAALGHLFAQTLFTVSVHLREVRRSPFPSCRMRKSTLLWLTLLGAPIAYLAVSSSQPDLAADRLYLRFIVFYGLVFPAWALLFIIPARPLARSTCGLILFAFMILVSAPLYEMGYIGHETWLLPIPLAALLLIRWAAPESLRRAAPVRIGPPSAHEQSRTEARG